MKAFAWGNKIADNIYCVPWVPLNISRLVSKNLKKLPIAAANIEFYDI